MDRGDGAQFWCIVATLFMFFGCVKQSDSETNLLKDGTERSIDDTGPSTNNCDTSCDDTGQGTTDSHGESDTGQRNTQNNGDSDESYTCSYDCLPYSDCYGEGTFQYGRDSSCPDGQYCCDLATPPPLCKTECAAFSECSKGIDFNSYCEGRFLYCCYGSTHIDVDSGMATDNEIETDTGQLPPVDAGDIKPRCPLRPNHFCVPRVLCPGMGEILDDYACFEWGDACCKLNPDTD